MSVKEYFAHPIIKQKIIEFLKSKGDFENLHQKHKRSFRGYIKKFEKDDNFYVSDDYHHMKCEFSKSCIEKFEHKYP